MHEGGLNFITNIEATTIIIRLRYYFEYKNIKDLTDYNFNEEHISTDKYEKLCKDPKFKEQRFKEKLKQYALTDSYVKLIFKEELKEYTLTDSSTKYDNINRETTTVSPDKTLSSSDTSSSSGITVTSNVQFIHNPDDETSPSSLVSASNSSTNKEIIPFINTTSHPPSDKHSSSNDDHSILSISIDPSSTNYNQYADVFNEGVNQQLF